MSNFKTKISLTRLLYVHTEWGELTAAMLLWFIILISALTVCCHHHTKIEIIYFTLDLFNPNQWMSIFAGCDKLAMLGISCDCLVKKWTFGSNHFPAKLLPDNCFILPLAIHWLLWPKAPSQEMQSMCFPPPLLIGSWWSRVGKVIVGMYSVNPAASSMASSWKMLWNAPFSFRNSHCLAHVFLSRWAGESSSNIIINTNSILSQAVAIFIFA